MTSARLFQSTHPHGVRLSRGMFDGSQIRFNPRTHTGCDTTIIIVSASGKMFQSTHPHGVRQIVIYFLVGKERFQSTHPHGVRPRTFCRYVVATWFQSTHPHGVRLYIQQMSEYQLNKVSISRS